MTRKAEETQNIKAEELQIDKEIPDKLRTATFSMGCFWGPEALFGGLDGIYRTRVGYTGGEKEHPEYRSLGDHTETVQIDYDPEEISYEELLDVFWSNHDYTAKRKPQYASKIFYHTERQLELARETKSDEAETQILPMETFWLAEDYHQKYHLRQYPEIIEKFEEIYSPEEFINSTAAAKLNAITGGKLDPSEMSIEIKQLEIRPEKLG